MMPKIAISCLILFALVCASHQQGRPKGAKMSKSASTEDGNHPYSYTYDWFHRSKLDEVVGEPPRRKLVVCLEIIALVLNPKKIKNFEI